MLAVTVRDRTAGIDGLRLTELPYPHAAENDVVVQVHAAGFTRGELDWPATWTDRAGRDRTPSVPGHELSGVVVELGFGTTGLTIGQRVFGLADWARDGSLAEYAAVEARNLAPLPADIDHNVAAAVPISGLTAWQGLFGHARLVAGQTALITGAAAVSGRWRSSSPARRGHEWSAPVDPPTGRPRSVWVQTSSSTWSTSGWTGSGRSTWSSTLSAAMSWTGPRPSCAQAARSSRSQHPPG